MRSFVAMLLALVLAIRLLTPAGFMPSFDSGALTIVACPDAGTPSVPAAHHGHGEPKKLHQPCPYASASSLGSLAAEFTAIAALLLLSLPLLLGRPMLLALPNRARERPPLRGPPIPA